MKNATWRFVLAGSVLGLAAWAAGRAEAGMIIESMNGHIGGVVHQQLGTIDSTDVSLGHSIPLEIGDVVNNVILGLPTSHRLQQFIGPSGGSYPLDFVSTVSSSWGGQFQRQYDATFRGELIASSLGAQSLVQAWDRSYTYAGIPLNQTFSGSAEGSSGETMISFEFDAFTRARITVYSSSMGGGTAFMGLRERGATDYLFDFAAPAETTSVWARIELDLDPYKTYELISRVSSGPVSLTDSSGIGPGPVNRSSSGSILTYVEQIRKIPVAVPEPSTLISGGMAVLLSLGYCWTRHRRSL